MAEEKTVKCPDCGADIKVASDVEVGDVYICDACGVEVEVINTDPIEVDYLLVEK